MAVAEQLSFEKFAAVTLRLPELPGVSPLRSFTRYYPEGAAVGHLIGYVGAPNREEYEAENRDPLLISPGFKIGKEGLEKVHGAAAARPAGRGPHRGDRARRAGARPVQPARRARAAAQDDDRRRPAELRRAAAGR